MRRIIAFLIAVAIATLILAGCDVAEWDDTPLFERNPIPVVIVEQETILTTEPTENHKFGQIVWSVVRSADGGDAYLERYMVFAQEGDLVAVVPLFNPSPEETREVLIDAAQMPLDGSGHLYLVLASNCYPSREQAQEIADRENREVEG